MISQPMANKTEQEITETHERAKNVLEALGYEFINTYFTDEWYSPESMKERGVENVPLCFPAKSLENMSKCRVAYFCKGWEETRDVTNSEALTKNDVYVVWFCKTLQNFKVLLSTTVSDGMYYEVTFNGDKNEYYLDAYKKWQNVCYN